MSELRWDPLKRQWVITATECVHRPRDFGVETGKAPVTSCPFCYGNEDRTPAELFALRAAGAANSPGWRVRVIPDKYPALGLEGEPKSRAYGPYRAMDGVGAHEVIVETPDHDRGMADLGVAELGELLAAWRSRLLELGRDQRFRYLVLFKNHGRGAGAALSHSHSELLALPFIPPAAATELKACRRYYESKRSCLCCDLIGFELSAGERVVLETERFVALAPYASRSPFELRLYPKRHCHDFTQLDDAGLAELAAPLKELLLRLKGVLDDPAYHLILHTAPPQHGRPGRPGPWRTLELDYHWHIELVPMPARGTGLGWGRGFYLNPTPPEQAAGFLREADLGGAERAF